MNTKNTMNTENSTASEIEKNRQMLANMQQDPVYRQNIYTLLAQKPEGIQALLARLQKSEDRADFIRILTALRRQAALALRYAEVLAFLRAALQDTGRKDLHTEIAHTVAAGGVLAAQSPGMREALIAATGETATVDTRTWSVAALACIREDRQVLRRLAELIVMDPAPGVRTEAESALLELDWAAALVPLLKLTGALTRSYAQRRYLQPGAFFRRQAALLADKFGADNLSYDPIELEAMGEKAETGEALAESLEGVRTRGYGAPALKEMGEKAATVQMLAALVKTVGAKFLNDLSRGNPGLAAAGVHFAGIERVQEYPEGKTDGFDWWFSSPNVVDGSEASTLMISMPKPEADSNDTGYRLIQIENLVWTARAEGSFVGYLLLSLQGNQYVGEMEWRADLPTETEMNWRFTEVPDVEMEEEHLGLLCDTQKSKTSEYQSFLLKHARQGSSVALAALGEMDLRLVAAEVQDLFTEKVVEGNPIAVAARNFQRS